MSWCNPSVRTPFCQDDKCPACSPHRPPEAPPPSNVTPIFGTSVQAIASNFVSRVNNPSLPRVRSAYIVYVDENQIPDVMMFGKLIDLCFCVKFLDSITDNFIEKPAGKN